MKQKKKGFTLIELLAVIVILAIIALIATPVILNIIEKSKKAAFTRSLENIVKTSKTHYMESLMMNEKGSSNFKCSNNECFSIDKKDAEGNHVKLEIDGSIGTGDITIDSDGNISLELSNYGYCGTKLINENKINVTKGNCSEKDEDTTNPIIQNINTSKTNNSITVAVNAYDDESGISKYEYSINDSEYKEGNNAYTFNDLTPGTYKIKVKVTNGVNLYTEEEKEVIIEKEKPICPIPVITTENKDKWTTSKKVTIDYGNVEGCTGKYSLDGSNYIEGTNVEVNENTTIYALNEGGESNAVSQETVTKIDTSAPTLDITTISSTTKQIEITFNAEDEQSNIKNTTCEYGETNSYGQTGTINNNKCILSNLKDNTTYYYKISTTNNAELTTEKEGNSKTGTFSTITITPSTKDWASSKTYTITGTTTGAHLEYKITNGSTLKQDWTDYKTPITINYESSETNKTVIYARQNDGINTSNEISLEETKIDVKNPLNITLSSNSNTNYNKSLNVTITLQDEQSGLQEGSIKYGWSTSNTVEPTEYTTKNISETTGNSTTTITASSSGLTGSYYLWVVPVNYKDKAGNINNKTVISSGTFNFDNTAPTLTLGTPNSTDKTITIPISTNTDEHSKVKTTTCVAGTSTSNYNKTGTISNNICTISGLNASTKYYYKVTSTDNALNSTEETGNITTLASITLNPVPSGMSGLLAVVYYNPETGKGCTESDYKTNLENYKTTNSKTTPTGQKTGCMKWYAYKDNGDTYDMILDHNTTATQFYNSNNDNSTCIQACTQLTSDTSSWTVNARMMTGQEIADITGNTSWNSSSSLFYFDSNSTTQTAKSKGASKYSWLFDYTNDCTSYGCNVAESAQSSSSTNGYWTSTPYAGNSEGVFVVEMNGYLRVRPSDGHLVVSGGWSYGRDGKGNFGIRPVITISK